MKKKLNHYSDALYWAMSPMSKDRDYHITRLQESILRKLLHYSKSNEKISYSNAIIAEHTFLKEETLRKEIPNLAKKGIISTASINISDDGEHKKRRTIFIKRDKLDFILSEVPKKKKQKEEESSSGTTQEETNLPGKKQHKEGVVLSAKTECNSKNDSKVLEKKHQEIPRIIVTDEKLNWVNSRYDKGPVTKENLETLSQENLELMFYGEDGIWTIDKQNFENKYLIRLYHNGGSLCKLSNQKVKGANLRLNIHNLEDYLKNKGLGFGDMTPAIYKHIQNNELPKRKLKNYN